MSMDQLLEMFSKLNTTDHSVLVKQFRTIIPIDEQKAIFYLEISEWNLEKSVTNFFELGGDQNEETMRMLNKPKPDMAFELQTIDVETMLPNQNFSKTWLIKNNGEIPWPDGTTLEFIGGEQMGGPTGIDVPSLLPGQIVDMSLEFCAPMIPNSYAGYWMLQTNGEQSVMFGEPIWVITNVAYPNYTGQY